MWISSGKNTRKVQVVDGFCYKVFFDLVDWYTTQCSDFFDSWFQLIYIPFTQSILLNSCRCCRCCGCCDILVKLCPAFLRHHQTIIQIASYLQLRGASNRRVDNSVSNEQSRALYCSCQDACDILKQAVKRYRSTGYSIERNNQHSTLSGFIVARIKLGWKGQRMEFLQSQEGFPFIRVSFIQSQRMTIDFFRL